MSGWKDSKEKQSKILQKARGSDVAKLPEQREHLKSIPMSVTFSIAMKQLCFGKWNLEQHLLAPVSGKKLLKDRVSILATCNATGEEKLPLLFINNSIIARGIDKTTLGIWYYYNKSAWMNALYLKV